MSRRDKYERVYLPALPSILAEFGKSVDEHVYSLVVIFVAAAYAEENGVLCDRGPAHIGGHFDKAFPRGPALAQILLLSLRGEAVLKAVWGHEIHLASVETGALAGGDVADRGKHIGIESRLLLE